MFALVDGRRLFLFLFAVSGIRFSFEIFSVILALVRRVKALSCFVDGAAKPFSEGGTLHGFDLRDGVNTKRNYDEQ